LRTAIARLRKALLDPPSQPLHFGLALPLYIVRLAIQLGKQWARDKCPQIAASLTFQSVLVLVPLFAVTSALALATGALGAQSALMSYLSHQVFPVVGEDFFHHVTSLVENVREGALGPAGIAITLVISYLLFHSVEGVFCSIWRAERRRSLWSKFIVFYTLATLVPFLLGLSLYHSAQYFERPGLRTLLPFLSIALAFTFANKLLPPIHVRWRAAIAGGLVSALAFELLKHLFATYVTDFALARYQGVYGSLAIIPIALVWMYVVWLTILFGTECAHAAQNLHALEALDRRARGDGDEKVSGALALRFVREIALHYAKGGAALLPEELADRFALSEDIAKRVIARLKAKGLLVEVQGEVNGLLLARPADQLKIEEILAAFSPTDIRSGPDTPVLDELLREVEQARRDRLSDRTVADLLG
jgi:membrane protein